MDKEYLESLGALIRQENDAGIAKLLSERSRSGEDFIRYMDRKISESKIKRNEIATMTGLSQDYLYKLLRKDKNTTERDYILSICISMKMNLSEVQTALRLYPFPPLDDSDERSAIIMALINYGVGLDEMNKSLDRLGYCPIKFNPNMASAEIIPHRSTFLDSDMINSVTVKGIESLNVEGDNYMENIFMVHNYSEVNDNNIRTTIQQMGCMPVDVGYVAEIKTDEFGREVYVSVSWTPMGDFYNVSEWSLIDSFDDEDEDNKEYNYLEEYESFAESMNSDYSMYFAKLDGRLNIEIAKTKLNKYQEKYK